MTLSVAKGQAVMFPFWESVVAPLIAASGAKRIIEIGALRGETTVLMLDALGPDAELHVVDPVPDFDPDEHVRRFPGRYVFHRDLSLNVLPTTRCVRRRARRRRPQLVHRLQRASAAARRRPP